MSKNRNKLPKYPKGGTFWKDAGDFAGNYGKAILDTGLSTVGAGDVISDNDYKGKSGNDFNKISTITGGVGKALLPVATGVAGGILGASIGNPMMGAQLGLAAGKGIQGIGGAVNPQQDPNGFNSDIAATRNTMDRVGNSMNGIYGMVPGAMGMFGAMKGQGLGPQMDTGMEFKMGGKMCYPDGGQHKEPLMNLSNDQVVRLAQSILASSAKGKDFNKPDLVNSTHFSDEKLRKKVYSDEKFLFNLIPESSWDETPIKALTDIDKQRVVNAIKNLPSSYDRNIDNFNNSNPRSTGMNIYADGGMYNSEVEKQENSITPQGEFTQYNGPSHEQGGIKTNLANGEMVFSDRLKMGKKTFAQLNKANNTKKEDKILQDSKAGNLQRLTAELMKEAKMRNSMKLFEAQESLKEQRMMNYAKRIGSDIFGNGGTKGNPNKIDRTQYTKDFERFDKSGASDLDLAGDISPSNILNLGFKPLKGVKDDYPVYTKDGAVVIRHPSGRGYVHIGNESSLKFDIGKRTPAVANQSMVNPNTIASTKPISNIPVQPEMPRQPMQFSPYQNYNPNTGTYLDPSTGAPVQPIVEQYSNGGMKRYDEGGLSTMPEEDPSEGFRSMLADEQISNDFRGMLAENGPRYDVSGGQSKGMNPMWGKLALQAGIGLANNAGNIYDLKRANEVETTSYGRVTPNLVDGSADMRYNDMQGRKAVNDIRNASVGNSATYLNNRKDLAINQMITNSRIKQQYDNQNAQIKNQAAMFNTNIGMQETNANEANRAASRNIKANAFSNIGQNTIGQYKDNQYANRDQQILDIIAKRYPNAMNDPAFKGLFGK